MIFVKQYRGIHLGASAFKLSRSTNSRSKIKSMKSLMVLSVYIIKIRSFTYQTTKYYHKRKYLDFTYCVLKTFSCDTFIDVL